MDIFEEYIMQIENQRHRARTEDILDWVENLFPDLEARIAWNQPMFTDHGTFIIGFSVAAKHLSVSPEQAGMEHFTAAISSAGYSQTKMLFRIKWDEPVNYSLLNQIIRYNRTEKADCKTFWRK